MRKPKNGATPASLTAKQDFSHATVIVPAYACTTLILTSLCLVLLQNAGAVDADGVVAIPFLRVGAM